MGTQDHWTPPLLFPAKTVARALLAAALLAGTTVFAAASDFSQPWKRADRALVIDAYEYNAIDWQKLASDKKIVGFINKGSDGLAPAYYCSGEDQDVRLCKALWKRHAVARELFHTRRTVAKALGLKWGAYHLARPGNPIEQADNFIDFAEPAPDDLMAIDIEDNDPSLWMSLDDAEIFVRRIRARTGRYPVLYTNDVTATHIAAQRDRYRLLSRLPLWYARYKPEIGTHFPKGNWQDYALWQFSAQANCNRRSCPYRVPGTPNDIDVNVAPMSAEGLRAAWPFGHLLDVPVEMMASVPLPISRLAALAGPVELQFASVELPQTELPPFAAMFASAHGLQPVQHIAAAVTHDDTRIYADIVMRGVLQTAAAARRVIADSTVTRSIPARPLPPPALARNDLPVFLLKETEFRFVQKLLYIF